MRNKTVLNESFNELMVDQVWKKGMAVSGVDPAVWRKDKCGAWIKRDMYGHSSMPLSNGWEIDHIKPVSKGGGDEINNLQPLQWENNRGKADNYPDYNCTVISSGNKNVYQ